MIEGIIHALVLDNDHKFSEILSRLTLPQKELLYAVAKEEWLSDYFFWFCEEASSPFGK